MRKKKYFVLFLSFVLLLSVLPITTSAYVLNSKSISNRLDAYYWIDPAFGNYSGKTTIVKNGILSWNSTPEIQFTKQVSLAGGAEIKVEYIDSYNGDTFAVSRGSGNITVYKKWREINTTQETETIAHEVGHELGLAHTQKSNDSIAVMREFGFNNKAYPLSDDIKGIAAKY